VRSVQAAPIEQEEVLDVDLVALDVPAGRRSRRAPQEMSARDDHAQQLMRSHY